MIKRLLMHLGRSNNAETTHKRKKKKGKKAINGWRDGQSGVWSRGLKNYKQINIGSSNEMQYELKPEIF